MKKILKKIKLVDEVSIEIPINKDEFIEKLKLNVDEGNTGIISDTVDVFSQNKKEYKGYVGSEDFKIKKRKSFLDISINRSIATGKYYQHGELLKISSEINGFCGMMIPFYALASVCYLIFVSHFFSTQMDVMNNSINEAMFSIPFLIIHAFFMFGIPYIIMKMSVDRMKKDLKNEFYFINHITQLKSIAVNR